MPNSDLIEELFEGMRSIHLNESAALGFKEYLRLVLSEPAPQCRSAAHFIRDAFDFFGRRTVSSPAGERKRFRLFDATFCGGFGRVAGQEEVQESIYRLLNNFMREGRTNRLILLHGPNGSAKTSIIRAIVRGMEHYSTTTQGALYRFRWLFPAEKTGRGSIGFGDRLPPETEALDTFAHLPGDALDAVLECELKDHPLLLVPLDQRRELFERLRAEGRLAADSSIADVLLRGDLCAQCRRIYDALLATYGGDSTRVLRHVQVVRLHLSGRYHRGVATVEPQMHVDAGEQQLTASRGLAALPPAIAHLDLFQQRGPLVDANRGLLEYNDLLKRPIDAFKYLLVTCENGQVTLERSTLHLDTVFIGSTNDLLLDSFKAYADFASFKGRLELVCVPYLRRASEEVQIYRDQVPDRSLERHLAPHTLELAALWAVLTRLRRPDPEVVGGSDELKQAVGSLSPLEKATLLDSGETPPRLASAVARELRTAVPDLMRGGGPEYEGRSGASAREVRMLLMNAAQSDAHRCLSPPALFDEIRSLLRDRSVFAFLQLEAEGDYRDQDKILDSVVDHYLDRLEDEAAEAMGLVSQTSYQDLFNRYVLHVSHHLRKEKLRDPVTGALVDPDQDMMREVEAALRPKDEAEAAFRSGLISRIGAYALESERAGGPMGPPDYARVFPAMFERLRDDFVTRRRSTIQRNLRLLLGLLQGDPLEPHDNRTAAATRAALGERFGYCDECAQAAVAFLVQRRFTS